MTTKMIGNRGYFHRGGGISGVGIENVGSLIGNPTTVTATVANDVIALSVMQLTTQAYQMGVVVQSEVPVSIKYSLSNPELSTNADPLVRASAMWTSAQSIPANEITTCTPMGFVAVEITFSAPGTLVFYAR